MVERTNERPNKQYTIPVGNKTRRRKQPNHRTEPVDPTVSAVSAEPTKSPPVSAAAFSLFTPANVKFLSAHPDDYDNMSMTRFANSISNITSTVAPNIDFYNHVNSDWLKHELVELKKKPKYFVKDDDFRVIQDTVYHEIIDSVDRYIADRRPNHKNLSNLVDSLRRGSKTKLRAHASQIAQDIDRMVARTNDSTDRTNGSTTDRTTDDSTMYDMLAYVASNEIVAFAAPIVWSQLPDEKNVKKLVPHLFTAQLSFDNLADYTIDSYDSKQEIARKKQMKKKYFAYIRAMFAAIAPTQTIDPQDIWDVELELDRAIGCNEVKEPSEDFYNPLSSATILNDLGFDWDKFARKLGYSAPPKRVIVSSLNAVKCTARLVRESWNTPKWVSYWKYIFYKQMIRFDDTWRDIDYKFNEQYILGQDIKMPLHIYPIFGLSHCCNTLVSTLYAEQHMNSKNEAYVASMLSDLKRILIRKIEKNRWLAPATKRLAVKKMHRLEHTIGTPSMEPDFNVDFTADDPWQNLASVSRMKRMKNIKRDGELPFDTPDIDWKVFKLTGTQLYMVNAYYRPMSNSIFIPMAYLRKPFLDLNERGIEYNLAYMGYTIGHELCHSLDDMGSKFDGDGNMNEWWTPGDRRAFKKQCNDVIAQYHSAAEADGLDFDASLSIGEDLADIGGLALVEEYLFTFLTLNQIEPIVQRISFREFYTYTAIQSRQEIQHKAIAAEMRMNPHPLEKYRCNCPLARSKLFRILYNVGKGGDMWWKNTDQIW